MMDFSWFQYLLISHLLISSNIFYQVDGHHIFVWKLFIIRIKIVSKYFLLLRVFFILNIFSWSFLRCSWESLEYKWLSINKFFSHNLRISQYWQCLLWLIFLNCTVLIYILIDSLYNMALWKCTEFIRINIFKPLFTSVSLN